MTGLQLNHTYIYEQKDLDRVISWLADKSFFMLDCETEGTNPFTAKLLLFQVGNEDVQWIIDCRTVNIEPLRRFVEDPKIMKLGQNIKFDVEIMMVKLGWSPRNVVCTMVAEQIIRCGLGVYSNMRDLAYRYLRLEIDKSIEMRTSFAGTPPGQLTEEQKNYAAGDVLYPLLIARKQKPLIKQRGLTNTILLEHSVIPVIARMEITGMGVDRVAWNKIYQSALVRLGGLEKELDGFFGVTPLIQGALFEQEQISRAVDYNSPKQILKALNKMGYPLANTKKETIALAAILGEFPFDLAQAILSYRKFFKRKTTYGTEFLKAIEEATGRIHSDFSQTKTTSGRLSSGEEDESESDKVNLQNIPRVSEYRHCFVPRPGYKFIIYDYQAIEPRILGEFSHDPTFLHAFDNDLDLYGVVGTKLLGEEVSKREGRPSELRDKTKITVLGNMYGTGKEKFHRKMLLDSNLSDGMLSRDIKYISREDSDKLWEGFFETCPNIKETLDKFSDLANPTMSERTLYDEIVATEDMEAVAAKVRESMEYRKKFLGGNYETVFNKILKKRSYVSYSETLGGRKRFYKVYHRSSWTDGRNQPIQGTAADILKTAMVNLHEAIERNNSDAVLVNQVHDEIIIEVKNSEAEHVDSYVKPIIYESEQKFLKRVPAKAEGGIRDRWEK